MNSSRGNSWGGQRPPKSRSVGIFILTNKRPGGGVKPPNPSPRSATNILARWCIVLYCIVLYCIVLQLWFFSSNRFRGRSVRKEVLNRARSLCVWRMRRRPQWSWWGPEGSARYDVQLWAVCPTSWFTMPTAPSSSAANSANTPWRNASSHWTMAVRGPLWVEMAVCWSCAGMIKRMIDWCMESYKTKRKWKDWPLPCASRLPGLFGPGAFMSTNQCTADITTHIPSLW